MFPLLNIQPSHTKMSTANCHSFYCNNDTQLQSFIIQQPWTAEEKVITDCKYSWHIHNGRKDVRTYCTQGWTKKSRRVWTSSTEILICGINITANIFLNNVLKFVNTYIQLIKHQFKVRKCRLSNQHHRKLNKNYFTKLNCSLHVSL